MAGDIWRAGSTNGVLIEAGTLGDTWGNNGDGEICAEIELPGEIEKTGKTRTLIGDTLGELTAGDNRATF